MKISKGHAIQLSDVFLFNPKLSSQKKKAKYSLENDIHKIDENFLYI